MKAAKSMEHMWTCSLVTSSTCRFARSVTKTQSSLLLQTSRSLRVSHNRARQQTKKCSSPTWHAHLCQDNTVSDRFRMFWWYHDISIYHISLITNISYRYLIGSTLIVYIQCISCKKKIRPGLPKKLTLPKMKIQHFDTLILSPNLRPHMISVT